jgi:hypothetical protein
VLCPQFSMQSLIKHENVMKPSSAIPFSSTKQNDVNTYSPANVTVARLPRSVEQRFTVDFCVAGSFIVKLLILQQRA